MTCQLMIEFRSLGLLCLLVFCVNAYLCALPMCLHMTYGANKAVLYLYPKVVFWIFEILRFRLLQSIIVPNGKTKNSIIWKMSDRRAK